MLSLADGRAATASGENEDEEIEKGIVIETAIEIEVGMEDDRSVAQDVPVDINVGIHQRESNSSDVLKVEVNRRTTKHQHQHQISSSSYRFRPRASFLLYLHPLPSLRYSTLIQSY